MHDVAALDVLVDGAPAYARRLAQMFWPGRLPSCCMPRRQHAELGDVAVDRGDRPALS